MNGLYVHVPFCVRKCSYCDFYSEPVGRFPAPVATLRSYVEAVLSEASSHHGLHFQTLYLGGGTPSLLGPGLLKELIQGLGRTFDLSGLTEATIEVNPDSTHSLLLQSAKEVGISRVSVGVQSLSDCELASVGRVHNAVEAIRAVELVKGAGFKSVSADVIVGLPGQTWPTLQQSLETLTRSGIQHLSVYCLSLEEGTPLATAVPETLPSDDAQADLFEQARSFLTQCGFAHYEISNFALPGHECRHNLNYWRGGEYLGLGPAAASHLQGKRFRNRADLAAYIAHPAGQVEYVEQLTPVEKAAEEAMLRLRLPGEGLDTRELALRFGKDNVAALIARLEGMATRGLLVAQGPTYFLPVERVLTSNPILAEVLGP